MLFLKSYQSSTHIVWRLRTGRDGKEAVKSKDDQKLQAFVTRAIGSPTRQRRKWKKLDCWPGKRIYIAY